MLAVTQCPPDSDTDARLETRLLDPADESRWDEFVRTAKGGTFYHLSGWKRLVENELHHRAYYFFCEQNGRIMAILPLVHVRSLLFGSALISVPFLVYGGPVSVSDEARDQLVDAARALAQELGVDYLELRNQVALEGDWHSRDGYVTFRREMDPDPDVNLKAIPRKQRAMIRKGIKAGLTAEIDGDAGRLHETMLECKRNLGTPFFGRRWLQAIKDEFADNVEILTVTRGPDTVCSVMSFLFGDEILPYYGGGGILARDLKGNDFMYWAVMERACTGGYRVFDYGRSAVGGGAYRFKKHWGFEPEPLAYQVSLVKSSEVPNLSPSNPKYDALIRAWKKLPLPVAAMLGPPIARRLG